jgi:hypothetical protein
VGARVAWPVALEAAFTLGLVVVSVAALCCGSFACPALPVLAGTRGHGQRLSHAPMHMPAITHAAPASRVRKVLAVMVSG